MQRILPFSSTVAYSVTEVVCETRLGVFATAKMDLLSDNEFRRFGLFEKDLLGEVEVSMRVVSGDLIMNFNLRLRLVNFLMRD